MKVMPARRAGPRLTLLLGDVALEGLHVTALRALGMFAIGRVARPPEMLKAGGVVGELG